MNQSPISESEPPHSPTALLASRSSHPPLEKFTVTPVSASNSYSKDVPESKPTPWYRATKGVAIMTVVAFVLVAVAVGVTVGVTQNQNKKGSNMGSALRDPKTNITQASASSGGGGVSPTFPPFPSPSPTPSPLTTASGFVSPSASAPLPTDS